jgi:LysM repeat protein
MAMELIKENIECEQLLTENFCDTVVKSEYVIPDTHPDVNQVLMIDAKPCIISKEIMQDKILVEGQIEYTLLYLAKEEESTGIYSTNYTGKFSNYVDVPGAEHKMLCDSDCYIEHIECMIVNERKISIEGIVKLKAEVYKNYEFKVIRDVTGSEDIQMLKNPSTMDKIVGTVSGDLVAKCHMQIPMDNPQIGSILKCDVKVHKKETKVMEGKVSISANALIKVLYRGKDSREIVYMEEDVSIDKELESREANPTMDSYSKFRVDAMEFNIREDDLGENRIIDVEAIIKSDTKVMYKEDMDIIQDAYSPSALMQMSRKDYQLNVMHGHSTCQNIVKGTIELNNSNPKVSKIIMCCGKVCVTDKKLVEDKVIVEGVLNVEVLYKTFDEEKYLCTVNEEIPFNYAVEIPGCKIDMQCIAKVCLENVEASIELNNIDIKALIEVYARVNYLTHKEFLVDMEPIEGEIPKKKASLTIYVVQHGDTLWKIAKKYYTTIQALVKLNEIEDADAIKVGDKLIIPGRAII